MERGRRRKIDQHVAVLLVDLEAGIFGYGRGNRFAHAAVGANRLMRIGWSAVRMTVGSWRKAERRAMTRRSGGG